MRDQNVLDATGRTTEEAAAKFKRPAEQVNASLARSFQAGPKRQIVVAGTRDAPDTAAMLKAARKPFLPDSIVLLADTGASQEFLASHGGFCKDRQPLAGKATAYVCQNFACHLPTSDLATMQNLLATTPTSK